MKQAIIIGCCLLLCYAMSGQRKWDQKTKEKMETMRIGFITEKLELSSDEAKQFWPIFEEFKKDKEALRSEVKKDKDGDITDDNADQILENILVLEQKQIELKKKYFEAFKEAIPAAKIVKLHYLESEFKKDMIRKYRVRHGGDDEGHSKRGRE